jgi:hypothetical protein
MVLYEKITTASGGGGGGGARLQQTEDTSSVTAGGEVLLVQLLDSIKKRDRVRIVATLREINSEGICLGGSRGMIYDCAILAQIFTTKSNMISSNIPRTFGLREAFQEINKEGV